MHNQIEKGRKLPGIMYNKDMQNGKRNRPRNYHYPEKGKPLYICCIISWSQNILRNIIYLINLFTNLPLHQPVMHIHITNTDHKTQTSLSYSSNNLHELPFRVWSPTNNFI